LWAQAPRVREATARVTTAAILVMVMEYFASFFASSSEANLVQKLSQTRKSRNANVPAFGKY
jgi:hypothetical protein